MLRHKLNICHPVLFSFFFAMQYTTTYLLFLSLFLLVAIWCRMVFCQVFIIIFLVWRIILADILISNNYKNDTQWGHASAAVIIKKANDKYFWSLLFPYFLFFWVLNQAGYNFQNVLFMAIFSKEGTLWIKSFVLYIPIEKCRPFNIPERRTRISVLTRTHKGRTSFNLQLHVIRLHLATLYWEKV